MLDNIFGQGGQKFAAHQTTPTTETVGTVSKAFVANVFSYMFAALAISGITAYWFASSGAYLNLVGENGLNGLGYLVMFAPLGIVLLMGAAFKKLSSMALLLVFITYSVLMGMSLSFILLVYSASTIYLTFGVTAVTFGTMALLGYTTTTDLTKFGNLLYMALFGIIFAMILNWFMQSSQMEYIISIIGVLIFTGLTAYDVQKIKRIGAGVEYGTESASKLAIMGALNLYLDFVNLFLFLLRIFGGRD